MKSLHWLGQPVSSCRCVSFYRSMRTDSCFEQCFPRELYLYLHAFLVSSSMMPVVLPLYVLPFYIYISNFLFTHKEIVAGHIVRTSIASMKLPLASALRKYFDYTCIHYILDYIVLSCTKSRTKKKRIFFTDKQSFLNCCCAAIIGSNLSILITYFSCRF